MNSKIPNIYLKGIVWVAWTVLSAIFSALFTHFVAPQAAGSGIPQLRAIIGGYTIKGLLY